MSQEKRDIQRQEVLAQTLNSESDQESSNYVDDFDQGAVSTALLTVMNHAGSACSSKDVKCPIS